MSCNAFKEFGGVTVFYGNREGGPLTLTPLPHDGVDVQEKATPNGPSINVVGKANLVTRSDPQDIEVSFAKPNAVSETELGHEALSYLIN